MKREYLSKNVNTYNSYTVYSLYVYVLQQFKI